MGNRGLVKIFEDKLDLLDLMLSDMSNITKYDITCWLKETREDIKKVKNKTSKFNVIENDKKHGIQLGLKFDI